MSTPTTVMHDSDLTPDEAGTIGLQYADEITVPELAEAWHVTEACIRRIVRGAPTLYAARIARSKLERRRITALGREMGYPLTDQEVRRREPDDHADEQEPAETESDRLATGFAMMRGEWTS